MSMPEVLRLPFDSIGMVMVRRIKWSWPAESNGRGPLYEMVDDGTFWWGKFFAFHHFLFSLYLFYFLDCCGNERSRVAYRHVNVIIKWFQLFSRPKTETFLFHYNILIIFVLWLAWRGVEIESMNILRNSQLHLLIYWSESVCLFIIIFLCRNENNWLIWKICGNFTFVCRMIWASDVCIGCLSFFIILWKGHLSESNLHEKRV